MSFIFDGAMFMTAMCIGILIGIAATTIAYYVMFPTFKEKLVEMCIILDSLGTFGTSKASDEVKKEEPGASD